MKGFLLFFAVFFGLCAPAYASKPSKVYVGADFISTEVRHQYFDEGGFSATNPNRSEVSSQAISGGVFAGFKSYSRRYFVAPEIFFDYINNKTPDFYTDPGGVALVDFDSVSAGDHLSGYQNDEMVIDYRYGFRMNFGYRPTTRLDLFANVGVAAARYVARWGGECQYSVVQPYCSESYSVTETTPIYGVGMAYNVNDSLLVRAAYDFQRIEATYIIPSRVDQVDISTFRLGVAYQFNVWD